MDCLREIHPPHNHEETPDETNLRLAAQWESDCAFESNTDWQKDLNELMGISNLVDDNGDPVEQDFEDQADMCELIRAAYSANKFPKHGNILTKINREFVSQIECVGDIR